MKYISNGRGSLPLLTLIALLSVSLTVNLPGLAVSPLMGRLADLFPSAGQLDIQLLTLLPNLVIIPMILLTGRIVSMKNQTAVLSTGLVIFLLAGILYCFADSMTLLIALGALLGVGCGLIVPIAAGLLSEWFYGKEKVKVLGYKSGTSNGIVIIATIFVGWAASESWHDAFLVYLVPVIPLALIPFMTVSYIKAHLRPPLAQHVSPEATLTEAATPSGDKTSTFPHPAVTLAGVIALYIGLTAAAMVFTYYLPFTMKHYGLSTSQVGLATAMFYVTAMTGGFMLSPYLRLTRKAGLYGCIIIMAAGLLMLGCFHSLTTYVIGVLLIGMGYGFFQPIIYNKTTLLAPDKAASTKYFSYTLAGNYVAVACVPLLVESFQWLLHDHAPDFPYFLSTSILTVILIIGICKRKSFVWTTG